LQGLGEDDLSSIDDALREGKIRVVVAVVCVHT
jgi:hypothetical protein